MLAEYSKCSNIACKCTMIIKVKYISGHFQNLRMQSEAFVAQYLRIPSAIII